MHFYTVNEPGLWGYERYVRVEIGKEHMICGVVPTKEAAAGSDFKAVMRQLAETLREDMKKRAESVKVKVTRPLASRRAHVLGSLGYVRVPRDDGVEYWRRTLDRL